MDDKFISKPMVDYMSKTLNDLKNNDFNYLLDYQRTNTRIKRFDFNMGDIRNFDDKPELQKKLLNKKFYILNYSFIGESAREGLNYSDYMFKPLSSKLISEHRDIFDKNFIVFINGRISLYVDIFCLEEYTYVLFDITRPMLPYQGTTILPGAGYYDLMTQKANVTILFLPNTNRISGPTSISTIKKYNNEIAMNNRNFRHTNPDVESLKYKYLTFASTNNTNGMVLYDVNNDKGKFVFDLTRYNMCAGRFLLDSISIPSLVDEIILKPGTKCIKIPLRGMPIPTENIIPFYREKYGYRLFDHKLKIKLIYPNLYVLDGDLTKEVSLFILYYKPDNTAKYRLTNYAHTYMKYTDNIERLVTMKILPEELEKLQLPSIVYSTKDYISSGYKDDVEYRYTRLQEDIIDFSEYNKNFYTIIDHDKPYSETINISHIDLDKRVRYDDKNEGGNTEFGKPMYVFVLGNKYLEYNHNMIRYMLIDGLFVEPDHRIHNDVFDYIYIDCNKIHKDAIIDIKYDISYVEYNHQYIFTYFYDYVYELPVDKHPPIRLYNLSYTLNDKQMDLSVLSMYMKNYDNTFKEITDITSNEIVDTVKFNIHDVLLETDTIDIKMDKEFSIYRPDYNSEFNVVSYESNRWYGRFNNNSYFVYINGRKCPMNKMYIKKVTGIGKSDTHSLINAKINRSIKDKMIVLKMPRIYNQVLYKEKIDNTGFIDLTGIINRPFSLNYYIVYMNGRRLYKNKIEILSSTKIRLHDIDTLKHLEILERDIATDLFDYDDMETSISNKLYKYVEDKIIYDVIEDKEADAFDFNEDKDVEYADFYKYMIEAFGGLIECDNPDAKYDNVKEMFPTVCYDNTDIAVVGMDGFYNMEYSNLVRCDV